MRWRDAGPLRYEIDKSRARQLPADTNHGAVAAAIIELAVRLQPKVTAGGVEHADQTGFLRGLGCDDAQGNLFSAPAPPDAIAHLLGNGRLGAFSPRRKPAQTTPSTAPVHAPRSAVSPLDSVK